MSKTIYATGGCQCGAVRYAFSSPPEKSHACHCRMCQKAVGNIFATLVGTRKGQIRWTTRAPSYFASSNLARRGFCETCGTPLTFSYVDPNPWEFVTVGSLDDPSAVPIEKQFGVESKLAWVSFCEQVEAEKTGDTPSAAAFLANMQKYQA